MEDLRAPAGGRFGAILNPTMLMTILIALVIIILLVMLFQSSSAGNNSSSPAQAATTQTTYTNPLNATMRANPFMNTAPRI
ncbi:ODV-E18 [Adoxophyes orana nucleopolyhedrovirus]|uniref:ODV-E18 n=1 Tax=Adoxophyes orana nucleopolyhedrovirus TaxID=542343 RepID=UPI0001829BE7|nr:ODV-E18 [Adoxophyes orana nucleopolyhedrovirus]ACF05314.1 ODV-E18 [Adoxophyes orana nucleopolyhedrovirus]